MPFLTMSKFRINQESVFSSQKTVYQPSSFVQLSLDSEFYTRGLIFCCLVKCVGSSRKSSFKSIKLNSDNQNKIRNILISMF